MSGAPRVTIAGAGLAGLTAALRLAERGYQVKLYEQKSMLGGNLASRVSNDGEHLDIYPHMYLNWYNNFWRVLGDVTSAERNELFAPCSTIQQLCRGEFPKFTALTDMYSWSTMVENLFSGVGPVADMFVFGYASIDLLAEQVQPTLMLHGMTLNGFLHARPYMTKRAAQAYDSFITRVWAVSSKLAPARDYARFLQYSVAAASPDLWLARGSAQRQVIEPLTSALQALRAEIVTGARVTSVTCNGGRAERIGVERTRWDEKRGTWAGTADRWDEEVDELILAVPPHVLSRLVRNGQVRHRIVDLVPEMVELSHLRWATIPILNLYFNRRLPRIPPEPVGLYGSRLALAFTDISQTWAGASGLGDRTVLAVSSSDADGLPGPRWEDDAMAMLEELAEYLDFSPGSKWGESPDIDWKLTTYNSNSDTPISVNETGTGRWRPAAACEAISNLSFAGDFCRTRLGDGMMTIELAVASGLEAAGAIVERRGVGEPVEIIEPRSLPPALFVYLRAAWAPYAASAAAWSRGSDCVRGIGPRLAGAQSKLRRFLAPSPK